MTQTRFRSSRLVGAHFGLTPRFQPGEMDKSLPDALRAGDKDVRATLPSLPTHTSAAIDTNIVSEDMRT
jgi:transposase